jgi:WD40 repeat protein
LGDWGSQIFTHLGQGDPIALISAYERDGAAAAWTLPGNFSGRPVSTASADEAPTHASLTLSGANATLRRFNGFSATPLQSQQPHFGGAAHVRVTPDGSRIVVGTFLGGGQSRVQVYDATSASALHSWNLDTRGECRAFAIDEDAQTLYTASIVNRVFNLETGALLHHGSPGAFRGGDLASDGSSYCYEKDGLIHVYERSGSSFASDFSYAHGQDSANVIMRFSRDGSMLGSAHTLNDLRSATVQALRIANRQLIVNRTVQAPAGGYQNFVTSFDISDDGKRLAAGLSGDGSTVPEVWIYSIEGTHVSTDTLDNQGSCTDLDLSADGKRLVVSFKDAHLNTFSAGRGEIELYDLEARDFDIVGTPHRGGSVTIEMQVEGNAPGYLLSASKRARRDRYQPRLGGVLYLRRSVLQPPTYMGVGQSGTLSMTLPLSSAAGVETLVQGLMVGPVNLSESWAKITTLP